MENPSIKSQFIIFVKTDDDCCVKTVFLDIFENETVIRNNKHSRKFKIALHL